MKSIYLFFTILLLSTPCFSQGEGELVIIQVKNVNEYFVCINEEIHQKRKFILEEGEYAIKLWSPSREILDTTIIVKKNAANRFLFSLERTFEKKSYDRKLKEKRKFKGYGITVFGLTAAHTIFRYVRVNNALDDLNQEHERYQNNYSPELFSKINNNLRSKTRTYYEYRDRYNQSLIILGGGILGGGILYWLGTRVTLPKLNKDVDIKFKPYCLNIDTGNSFRGNNYGMRLTYNF